MELWRSPPQDSGKLLDPVWFQSQNIIGKPDVIRRIVPSTTSFLQPRFPGEREL
jgi:hypothetical protein